MPRFVRFSWSGSPPLGRWVATGLAAIAAVARPVAAADPARVQQAIDRGHAFLFDHQVNGNWEAVQARNPAVLYPYSVENLQWGGMTALATLSLLSSGVDAADPHVKRAVDFLRSADIRGSYALGLRAQVWGLLPPAPWTRQAEAADLQQLERSILVGKDAGPAVGLYGYAPGQPISDADHSVSQFAVLGVWSLAQAGLEVPMGYWRLVDETWHRHQLPSGGWGYRAVQPQPAAPDPAGAVTADPKAAKPEPLPVPPTLSMTAAGLATLFITQEFTQIAPRCNGNLDDPAIDAGLRYLGANLTDLPGGRHYYTLFGLSRVGLASGYRYLGATDWFKWGSDQICLEQSDDGSWTEPGTWENYNNIPDTAFALLFLGRGRAPIMVSKLRYDVTTGSGRQAKVVPGLWNQRPRDVANLARWVGRQIESPLNWQVVTLDESPEDLHDGPILYLAGGRAPRLSADDVAKLRAYAEDGGLILGHADCGSSDFAKGFRALGEQMFPGHRFRPLEANSPVYTNETFPAAAWKAGRPVVEALSNGTRELMVLLPAGDPARQWQTQSFRSVKSDVYGQLMIDLFLYAVDRQGLRRRGETYLVARQPAAAPTPAPSDGAVPPPPVDARVARVKYDGNWDPEPGGWRRLSNVLHNAGAAEVTTDPVDGPIDKSYPLASLTIAAADARLTDGQRSAIRDYVRGGGTLLVDAAGGRGLYRAAAEAELARIFPDAPRELPVLPPDDPLFAAAGPDRSAASVEYRRFERPAGNPRAPQLRGYAIGGRWAVLYSREDVSVGLVGQAIDGVAGYVPADAAKVVADVVLYAARRAVKP